jgi:hypothetical protein
MKLLSSMSSGVFLIINIATTAPEKLVSYHSTRVKRVRAGSGVKRHSWRPRVPGRLGPAATDSAAWAPAEVAGSPSRPPKKSNADHTAHLSLTVQDSGGKAALSTFNGVEHLVKTKLNKYEKLACPHYNRVRPGSVRPGRRCGCLREAPCSHNSLVFRKKFRGCARSRSRYQR